MEHTLKRILIIEDEPDIQAVAQLALEAVGGYTVAVCSSGRDALATAPSFAPDLILLDVMMPGMDGPTTLQHLRTSPVLQGTPVVFMTAKVQPQEIASYKALGAVDVIPKPFDPMALPEKLANIWQHQGPRSESAAMTRIQELRDNYVAGLGDKLQQIEDAWGVLKRDRWNVDAAHSLHILAHSMAGSGATFGFSAISVPARELELLMNALLAQSRPSSSEQRRQIERAIAALNQAYQERHDALADMPALPTPARLAVQTHDSHAPRAQTSASSSAASIAGDEQTQQLIYLLSDDQELAQDLAAQISVFGYTLSQHAGLDNLTAALAHATPAALLIEAQQLNHINGSIRSAIQHTRASLPIVVLSTYDDLDMCLRAVRAGGDAFFTIPINISGLVDKLDSLLDHQDPDPYRILIVDDDPELSEYHALMLRQTGMVASALTNPLLIMHELVEFRPDLVLMDMYMPHCNGLELAAVIRQQEAYVGIPIVFLSTEANLDLQLEAMHFGGDDFLTKPIHPDQLVSAITSRVRRSQALRSLMVRDSLTGLLKHTVLKDRLENELARAHRQKTQLAFTMIDIDHFKSVNDTYGHATGDRVIKSLARLLQQRLRKSDVIGRYGGEEFAVILPGTDGLRAKGVLDELRMGFAHIRQLAGEAAFFSTFSSGIAEYPAYADSQSLIDAADRALYEAKRAGRNCVRLTSR